MAKQTGRIPRTKSIVILVREHFDGYNTYFRARGYVNGKLAEIIEYAYGYGSHGEYEMMKLLSENRHIQPIEKYSHGGTEALHTYANRLKVGTALSDFVEVSAKKRL